MDPLQTIEFLAKESWKSREQTLAGRLGLKIYPASTQTRNILREELKASTFAIEDVERILRDEEAQVLKFSESWYLDCRSRDYGEEWDPAEGNQQEDRPSARVVLGLSEGYLIGYALLYLYAKEQPSDLLAYLKQRRIPHAAKVRKDVLRVYTATKTKGLSESHPESEA